ncbi:hypothetical protein [Brevibacillus agri]|uniref:hypothetical protein n=1 Tax=Brevibacillus agri TaxID=51101 RepID=UPI003D1BE5A6
MKEHLLRSKLEELFERSGERERLIKELQNLIYSIASEIIENLPERTTVDIPDVGRLKIKCFNAKLGSETMLTINGAAILDDYRPPAESFYLYNDFNCLVTVANLSDYINIANHLPTIIQSLKVNQESIIEKVRGAIDKVTQFPKMTDNPSA